MPQVSPLVLKDHGDTSVTFNPVERDGRSVLFQEVGVTPVEERSTVKCIATRNTRQVKSYLRFRVPYIETDADGNSVVVDIATAELELSVPNTLPQDQQQKLAAFVASSLSAAFVEGVVKNGEGIW